MTRLQILIFYQNCLHVLQISYKQTEQLRENSYGTLTDTPELLHASYLKDVYSQVGLQTSSSFCSL